MTNQSNILRQAIYEQIAIEENICSLIEDKISEIEDVNFSDAKDLLRQVSKILENHYGLLNNLLTTLEDGKVTFQGASLTDQDKGLSKSLDAEENRWRISKILRDVYSALNLITISNTRLNTIGLALNSEDVANIALKHIEALAPLVEKISKLAPEVITRELGKAPRP